MSEHLSLPYYEAKLERKRHGGGHITERVDRKQFSDVQIFNLGQIKDEFIAEKEHFTEFLEPKLLFKVEVNQNVNEQGFIDFLNVGGIKVISASPTNKGYWVLLAEDENLEKVQARLREYGNLSKYKEFDVIESFSQIPPEEKWGEQLKINPLKETETAFFDIEIWRMEDKELKSFTDGLKKLIESKHGSVTDIFISASLCLLRVKINTALFNEIAKLREITRIDRPPKPYITYDLLSLPLDKIDTADSPTKGATTIAILDSGILSNHPLLEKAVADEMAEPLLASNKISGTKPQDDVGHGTEAAGIALYGNIKECIELKIFKPEIWTLSVKVLFKNEIAPGKFAAEFDPSELLEHQIEDAVRKCVSLNVNCRVVNISFGDTYKKMFFNKRQFPLAALLDDLAHELNLIFVVSSGNINKETVNSVGNYPEYLINEQEDVKIIDPASSAYALTVGSISQQYGPLNRNPEDLVLSLAKEDYPSPFTRVGLGYRGMIKPDLVEEGGNVIITPIDPAKTEDIGGKIIVLNHNWVQEGKLFSVSSGTSLSAPKVAHYAARLFNLFPAYSPNLIKALLIISAEIPKDRPSPLNDIQFDSSDTKLKDILKIYGYGKPNFGLASASDNNRVILKAENKIGLDAVHLYYFYLPKEFIETPGKKELSVGLVYNPPIRRNRLDYMGVQMEFHLFSNAELTDIATGYKAINITEELEEIIPVTLKLHERDMHPGVRTLKRGIHQKGIKIFPGKPKINADKPLVLAVISQSKWFKKDAYLQDYAVAVVIKHQLPINLYNLIKERLNIIERIRIKT